MAPAEEIEEGGSVSEEAQGPPPSLPRARSPYEVGIDPSETEAEDAAMLDRSVSDRAPGVPDRARLVPDRAP